MAVELEHQFLPLQFEHSNFEHCSAYHYFFQSELGFGNCGKVQVRLCWVFDESRPNINLGYWLRLVLHFKRNTTLVKRARSGGVKCQHRNEQTLGRG